MLENSGWINVEDMLPDQDELVLCWICKFGDVDKYSGYHELAWYLNGIWENYQHDDIENNPDYYLVTHWKELPDDPLSKNKLRKLKIEKICSNQ